PLQPCPRCPTRRSSDLELAAADAAGVPPARAAVEAEERRLDELDDGIEAAERGSAELRERRAAYAAGEDASMRSALEMLAAELRERKSTRLNASRVKTS